jgi:hypothetical protein
LVGPVTTVAVKLVPDELISFVNTFPETALAPLGEESIDA